MTTPVFPAKVNPELDAEFAKQLRAFIGDNLPLEAARDESTWSAALKLMLGHKSAQVRRAARRNRNTSEVPKKLFADAELGSPLVNEELNGLAQGGRYAKELAARHPNTSESTLIELCEQGFGQFVAMNTSTPEKLLWSLYKVPELWIFLAQNPKLPQALQEKLVSVQEEIGDETDDWEVRLELARNPNLLTNTIAQLMADPDWEVRELIAQRPEMTPDWLRALALDSWFGIREMVANHPRTPPDALLILSRDADEDVQRRVSLHANLPVQLLEEYASSDNMRLKMAAAIHPNTPQEILDRLGEDPQTIVADLAGLRDLETEGYALERAAKQKSNFYKLLVATHPNASATLLEQLAKTTSPMIRAAIIAHPNTSADLQQLLLDDVDTTWDAKAIANTLELAKKPFVKPIGFALNDARVRRAIAASSDTTSSWLEALDSDTDRGVLLALAQNDKTPNSVLSHLTYDEITRQLVLERKDLPEAIGEQIEQSDVTLAADKNTPARFLRLSKHQRFKVRGRVASNEAAPENILSTLALDREVQVRLNLLENPNLPFAVVQQLIHNDRFEVRQKLAIKTSRLDVLIALAKDMDTRVLLEIIKRLDAPTEALTIMAQYKEPNRNEVNENKVYRAVAGHPNISYQTLHFLARSKDQPTRMAVVQHPRTSDLTLEFLFDHGDQDIRWKVLVHPNTSAQLFEKAVFAPISFPQVGFWQLLILKFFGGFERTKDLASPFLFQLITPHLPLYRRIAQHPNTSVKVLKFFAEVANQDLVLQEFLLQRSEISK